MSEPRPWIVGWNAAEQIGSSVGDGYSGRITDPTTGAGLFNANLDPNVVGVDPLTGEDAPTGTDMGPGAAFRRQMQTWVINGDFAVLPPGGEFSPIVSDQTDADYNPLPGWTWTPDADSKQIAYVFLTATTASGKRFRVTNGIVGGHGHLSQDIAIPASQGQQYRALASVYFFGFSGGDYLKYQYLEDDLTPIGSEISTLVAVGTAETKVDAGLVPPLATRLRIRVEIGNATTVDLAEVRVAFLPAEATIGLASLTANSAGITTTETVIKQVTIPADTFVAGSVYRITGIATVTSTVANTVTVRVRIGPTTLTGAATGPAATATTTASNDGVVYTFYVTIRSVGAGGTFMAHVQRVSGAEPFATEADVSNATATGAVDTTVANYLELTAVTSAGTTTITFRQAIIECVMAS